MKHLLTTLAIESINSDVYTCVELQNEANRQHCARAQADEILVSGQLNAKLLANSFLHHGASQVFTELISGDSGNNFRKIPAPADLVGKPFPAALQAMHEKTHTILIGVESDGECLVNPNEHVIVPGDHLFVIASTSTRETS